MSNDQLERESMTGRLLEGLANLATSIVKAHSVEPCGHCGRIEGDHAHDGDWCWDEKAGRWSTTHKFEPVFADRICDVCSWPQSHHVVGKYCPPSTKTKLLTEFRPRGIQRVCQFCAGEGQIGRPGSGDSDVCLKCKGKKVVG